MTFERHPPMDRRLLIRHINDAHASFADLFKQLVIADLGVGKFRVGLLHRDGRNRGRLKEAGGIPVRRQQALDPDPQ